MDNILKQMKNKILVFDGAIGTELQKLGLKSEEAPEQWNIARPELIKKVHNNYVEAGSDIVQTNTFGANRAKLVEYGLEERIEEINKKAVTLVREAAKGHNIYISGSMGPTGKLLEPIGKFTFREAKKIYAEQARVLTESGVDLLTVETISDLQEARAAVIGIKEVSDLPVLCSLTYEKNGKTVSGTDVETASVVLAALGVDIIGINCSLGPAGMTKILKDLKESTNLPLSFKPNAGMPELDQLGNTIYPAASSEMAEYVGDAVENGASIIGGCCGTGPDYIKKVANIVKNRLPEKRVEKKISRLASRSKVIEIDSQLPTKIIGEKINPTGNKELAQEMEEYKIGLITRMAFQQKEAGADIIDLNIGLAELDQKKMMERTVEAVQKKINLPISIDTDDYQAMEKGLELFPGKALANSVTGEEESLKKVLPLVKKYGAAVIGLTLTEEGIPRTAEKRLKIAEKILDRAESIGINKKNVFIDPLALTAGSSQKQIKESLRALTLIKEKLNVNTVLGISNVSYGLPGRGLINCTFLAMALKSGLSLPILNPLDSEMMETVSSSDLLLGRDHKAKRFIKRFDKKKENNIDLNNTNLNNKIDEDTEKKENDPEFFLKESIIDGDQSYIKKTIDELLNNYSPIEIIDDILIPAIRIVGDRYEKGEYYLPQLMASAETMEKAVSIIRPAIEDKTIGEKKRLLMATVKGDIHDIGKNIVKIMLKNNGFKVYDLGKNVADDEILFKIKEKKIDIVALSSLMTTTMPALKRVTEKIKERFPDVRVIIGGAVVTESYAKKIGADGYAKDAFSAVRLAEKLI